MHTNVCIQGIYLVLQLQTTLVASWKLFIEPFLWAQHVHIMHSFARCSADIIISTLRRAAQRDNEKHNTYVCMYKCICSKRVRTLGETKIQGYQETFGKVSKNYSQSLCQFLSLPHSPPHPPNLRNACDVLRVWGQRGVCVIRLLLLLMLLLLMLLLPPLKLMNILANEAKEPPPMLRFCVMNSGSKCVVLNIGAVCFCLLIWLEWTA